MPIEAARLQVVAEIKGIQKTVRDLKSVKSTAVGAEAQGGAQFNSDPN